MLIGHVSSSDTLELCAISDDVIYDQKNLTKPDVLACNCVISSHRIKCYTFIKISYQDLL